MKQKIVVLSIVVFFFNSSIILSQSLVMSKDSLLQVIKTTNNDTTRINAINWLSYQYYINYNYDTSLQYAKQTLALSKAIKYKNGEAFAYLNWGNYHLDNHNSALAQEQYFTALKLFEEINEKRYTGFCCFNIGLSYEDQFNHSEALKYLYKALKYFEETGDKEFIANSLQVISGISYWQKKYDYVIDIQKRCLAIRKEMENEFLVAQSYMTIGNCFMEMDRLSEAFEYLSSAKKIYSAMKDPQWGMAFYYGSVADVYQKRGDSAKKAGNEQLAKLNYTEAEKNYLSDIAAAGIAKAPDVKSEALITLGKVSIKLNKPDKAKYYLQKGLSVAREVKNKENIRMAYLNLSALDSANGDYEQAYKHYKIYILYRDSLLNEESVRKTEGYKMQYEFEKKEDQIKLLSAENKLKTTLASKQKQQKEFAMAGIVAIIFAGGYGFYRYRRRKKLQSQQAVLSERLRISSELHDEVGATLSGIAMYSHLTKEQMKTGQTVEIEKSLNVMQQSSAQMVDKLSDIVWLINPEQDSLKKLITKLEEYARDMAAIKNMQVKISVPEKITDINLPVESRRNIYLFCKEAINNAVKYSNATLLELTLKEVNGKLEFLVSDNGKGFDAVLVRRGNGLENMQKRADEIGAKLILHSKVNEGVSVSMQCVTLA